MALGAQPWLFGIEGYMKIWGLKKLFGINLSCLKGSLF